MKKRESSINYWELLSCVIVLTAAFQTLCYILLTETFLSDGYGSIRLIIVLVFISVHYRSVFFQQFFKSFKALVGLLLVYLLVAFVFFQGFRIADPEMEDEFIRNKIALAIDNARSEMASKGYRMEDTDSRQVIEDSVRRSHSLASAGKNLAFKVLFACLISLLISWLAKKETDTPNHLEA